MASPFVVGQLLDVQIEKLTIGGDGLCRHTGFVIFVPLSCPGDFVKVQVTEIKKNLARAKIIEILKPSGDRRNPPCQYYSKCGGCNWQHINIDKQRSYKSLLVQEILTKNKIDFENTEPILCDNEFGYRDRIQLQCKNGKVGYFERKTTNIVDIDNCLIAHQEIQNKIPQLKQFDYNLKLDLRMLENGSVQIKPVQNSYELGFRQVNPVVNQKALETFIRWMKPLHFNTVFDLYAGAGNLSLPLARAMPDKKFYAVEINPTSCDLAHKQAEHEGLSNFFVFEKDVLQFLSQKSKSEIDLILVDPPRAGVEPKALNLISQTHVKNFLYMSCDPVTFARDIVYLRNEFLSRGRKLIAKNLAVLDMFPQTSHIEIISLFSVV